MTLIGVKGRSDRRRGVSISSDISRFIASGWATILSVDDVSSDVRGLLRLHSGYSANCDNSNILIRKYISSSGGGRSVMVEVDSRDSP